MNEFTKTVLALLTSFTLVFGFGGLALAVDNSSANNAAPANAAVNNSMESKHSAANNTTQHKEAEHKEQLKERLDDAHRKLCEAREKNIQNTMSRLSNRGQKQIDLYSGIATRVENFYTAKKLSISNYDALVADVNAKKAAAQSAVEAVKSATPNFHCDKDDPKGVAGDFKAKVNARNAALKAYRESVRNLIKAVKAAAEAANAGGAANATH